ncbi:transposase [Halanaerobium saccharolyticum]|uniref:Transposase n=1 Tax=Halanaerobium saccharolyticum TaxID=43595 RepID=A0A4R7YTU5_9FIRM|nr:transposase [Halanaerobium saccharolyticum]RAK10244.1 transposase [Halanaerobium saccharolyticum]TDW00456.1 transposase [Halanaerobium saccharolyticum]TDX52041.1 transposase [Halanaerobium saccharolyticum]
MEKRRNYTEEFKSDAVELSLNSDKSVKEITDDLGINYSNLTRWRKKYRDSGEYAFPGNEKHKLTPEQQKIKELEDEFFLFIFFAHNLPKLLNRLAFYRCCWLIYFFKFNQSITKYTIVFFFIKRRYTSAITKARY